MRVVIAAAGVALVMSGGASAHATIPGVGGKAAPATASIAAADEIVLVNGTRLLGVEIERVRTGRVFHRDVRGRRRWHEASEIAVVRFEDRPLLDAAEDLLAAGDAAAGLRGLVAALAVADAAGRAGDERAAEVATWLHVRLARLHASRGETVTAIAHAAEVTARTGERAWASLLPALEPAALEAAPPIALAEAIVALDRARRSVDDEALRERLGRLGAVIGQRARTLAPGDALPEAAGPPRSRGVAGADAPDDAVPGGGGPVGEGVAPGRDDERRGDGRDGRDEDDGGATSADSANVPPDEIDALLEAGRTDEALAACRAGLDAPREPGTARARSVPRLLHQHGRALEAAGRPRDALVRHLQAGLLHERSSWAAASLVRAARLLLELDDDAAGARRLTTLAAATARRTGRADAQDAATRLLDRLGAAGDGTTTEDDDR